nr:protein translocase subunit SecA, chloroplastic isoform X1 [Ipomoea batatas]
MMALRVAHPRPRAYCRCDGASHLSRICSSFLSSSKKTDSCSWLRACAALHLAGTKPVELRGWMDAGGRGAGPSGAWVPSLREEIAANEGPEKRKEQLVAYITRSFECITWKREFMLRYSQVEAKEGLTQFQNETVNILASISYQNFFLPGQNYRKVGGLVLVNLDIKNRVGLYLFGYQPVLSKGDSLSRFSMLNLKNVEREADNCATEWSSWGCLQLRLTMAVV